MRFFPERIITRYKIDQLKTLLKESVYTKVTNYNGNFIERLEMEKSVRIRNRDSELYEMIDEHLEKWLRVPDEEIVWKTIETNQYYGYQFSKLPAKLKRVMRQHDALLYEMELQKYIRPYRPDYDRRIEQFEKLMPDYTDEEFRHYVLAGNPFPSTLGRRARESARRSYKVLNDIIKSNVHKFKQFVTLTFAPEENKDRHIELNDQRLSDEFDLRFNYIDPTQFEIAKEKYTKCIKNIQERAKRKGIAFEYITVWELQKNGAYHFHMLCTAIPEEEKYKVPTWLDTNFTTGKLNNGFGLTEWQFGKSDVQVIKDAARISTYVSKYIIKSFMNVTEQSYVEYMNKKKYYCSKGLDRSEVTYLDNKMPIPDEKEYKLTYEKEYTNPYNDGTMKKVQYTKIV